jgi:cbb3-type cytochrome oxidase subunit 3
VLVVILLVGAVYYALVQHKKPAHRTAPEGELPEATAAATPS